MNQRQIFKIVLVHDIKYATSKAQTLHALYYMKIGAKELYLLYSNYHKFNSDVTLTPHDGRWR